MSRRPLRIAVDARELAPHPTGVGRYLVELLQAWIRDPEAADCAITLLAPAPIDLSAPAWHGPGARVASRALPALGGTAWEQLRLPPALLGRADVLFAPGYSAPVFSPVPTVVTVHDVSFFAHPEWFGRREGRRRRWTCHVAAANAARLLTVSEFSRREIVRWLGVRPDRIVVTPHGVTRLAPEAAAEVSDRPPLVLFVGTQLNRRHLPDLVRAFAPIARRDPRARLVLVGANRSHPREDARETARELGIGHAVESRPWISDAELAGLQATAAAFAWLSTYEGFGLPPLEAMAAGIPVVAYDTPVAREIYGDAADLVPVGDLDRVTAALSALVADPAHRAARAEAGRLRAERYVWDRPARATLTVLREAGS
jgi:glycosyltransferase involved in cell wall biosynthesis